MTLNSDDTTQKILNEINEDFKVIGISLKNISEKISLSGVTDHPIFIACKTESPLGKKILNKEELKLNWNYSVSVINEFISRKIISPDKEEFFLNNYKDSTFYCCLFILDSDFAKFVYIPYHC